MTTKGGKTLLFALFASAAILISRPSMAQSARPIKVETLNLENSLVINFVRVPQDKATVRVLAARVPILERAAQGSNPERAASGYSLNEYLTRYGAMVVLSGGYIDSYSPPTPLGLLRSQGLQINPIHRSWLLQGLFCSNEDNVEITLVDMDPLRRNFRDCVQGGPVMLLDGKVARDPSIENNENYRRFANARIARTFVCIDRRKDVIVGLGEKSDLSNFVSALRGSELGCIDAIGLTGAQSGGMWAGKKLFGNDDFLFPSVIAVMPKS